MQIQKVPNREKRRRGMRHVPNARQCWCGRCKRKKYSPAHLESVRVRQRKISIAHTSMFYECVVENNARPDDEERGLVPHGQGESASAEAVAWIEANHASGVDVIVPQSPLKPESEKALVGEVEKVNSLRGYLVASGVREADRALKIARYMELTELFRGRRLKQWIHNEFPGWLRNGENHENKGDLPGLSYTPRIT